MANEYDLGGRQSWPTMFFFRKWQHHPEEAPGILEYLYRDRAAAKSAIASGVASSAKSAHGLYESDFNLLRADHAGIRRLAAWVEQTVRQAVAVANGNRVNPDRVRVEIPESWSHITNDGGFHDAHYHGNCSWCGIYYVRAGDAGHAPAGAAGGPAAGAAGNGVSRFYSPIGTGGLLKDFGNAYLSSNRVDITPVEGMLLLFPSFLLHSGLPYSGREDRVLIAFNSRSHLVEERGGEGNR
jgi:hypothetical protein